MSFESVSARDLVTAIHTYRFPMTEPIFTYSLAEMIAVSRHVDWGGIARPTQNAAYRSIGEFWASALYNCLEDNWIDEHFETLGNSSIFEPADITLTSQIFEKLFPSIIGNLTTCYRSLQVNDVFGFVGIDSRGLFAIVWKEKHA